MEKVHLKNLLFAFITMLGFSSMAQDIILKKDGSEIQAKVLEITELQIQYKNFDFQNGPIRNINISEVFMITYEDGKKEVFNKQTSMPATSEKEIFSEQMSTPPFFENDYTPSVTDLESEFNRIGTNDAQMLDFFKRNDFTEYSKKFESACRQKRKGNNLLAWGIGIMVGGAVSLAIPGDGEVGIIISCVGIGVGGILTIVGIPVSASAGAKKKSIKKDFAKEYFGSGGYTYHPTLNFGVNANGIALTFSF